MPKLRSISGKQLIKIFHSFDFIVFSQKGSHIKMSRLRYGVTQTLVIPNHTSISKGTLSAIYTQALSYISDKELKKHFYS